MKKLIFWALVLAAGWYAWTHWPEIIARRPGHEAVIRNHSGLTLERVRLTVDGQTFVKEEIADEGEATFGFKVNEDSGFELTWRYRERLGDRSWNGGMVPKGPLVQRHVFTVEDDGGVTYHPERKLGGS